METGDNKLILLIDDDTSLLLTLSDFLIHEGYEVVTANSGEAGLKQLELCDPDLIILDMSMPGMGGVGFLREITDESGKPSHSVMVLTARANMADFFANVDVDGFIAKPCDPSDLLMEVGRIIFLRTSGKPAAESAPPTRGGRILLGEDDLAVQRDIARALENAGYTVDLASKGPQVLEHAVVDKPDVIVMKRVLLNMNGDAVADMLGKMPSTQDIPVVLYDDSTGGSLSARDLSRKHPAIKEFVSGNAARDLLGAVDRTLGVT
ncbi:MAG: response regulator [Verrucomicrobia bacterium]|nr:response regulator [Verrucomicrobiota bacterium]MDA1085806.1 response regulator [Verrucomicrobiota bacterium]